MAMPLLDLQTPAPAPVPKGPLAPPLTSDYLRARALRQLQAATGADIVAFVECSVAAGVAFHSAVYVEGDRLNAARLLALEGRPVGRTELLADRLTGHPGNNRFAIAGGEGAPDADIARALQVKLHSNRVATYLLCDGPRFAGWLVLAWRGTPCGAPALRAFSDAGTAAADDLLRAEAMDREPIDSPIQLLLSAGEGVIAASDAGSHWLTHRRTARIQEAVARLRNGDTGQETLAIDGYAVAVARLAGKLGKVYFSATIERAASLVLGPATMLTRRQREVAEYAAAGATAPEIAKTLSISAETVRDHLKQIYARLEVSSRLELAAYFAR